jgi:signal transduction histidine kinase
MFIDSDSKVFYPEIILTKHNKTEHTYKWTISKEYSPDDKEVLIFVGQDMSDTRRYETMIESLLADSKLKNIQLEEANAQLEIKNSELFELNTLKTEYISIASHDLRTPISQIMGLSQLLLRDSKNPLTEKQKKLLDKILESAEFQLSLVSDILDITKVETGYMKLELELTDINSLIKRSVDSLEELIQSKGIQINVHTLKEHRLVKIDGLKILQVINNLIGNAVKFTYEGGKIDVYTNIEDDWLVITVKDTGVGIKEKELEQIFDKFGSNRRKGTMGEKGTGLGLSICKKLIELHKGEIGVSSEYGIGSTFYFKTPIR